MSEYKSEVLRAVQKVSKELQESKIARLRREFGVPKPADMPDAKKHESIFVVTCCEMM